MHIVGQYFNKILTDNCDELKEIDVFKDKTDLKYKPDAKCFIDKNENIYFYKNEYCEKPKKTKRTKKENYIPLFRNDTDDIRKIDFIHIRTNESGKVEQSLVKAKNDEELQMMFKPHIDSTLKKCEEENKEIYYREQLINDLADMKNNSILSNDEKEFIKEYQSVLTKTIVSSTDYMNSDRKSIEKLTNKLKGLKLYV